MHRSRKRLVVGSMVIRRTSLPPSDGDEYVQSRSRRSLTAWATGALQALCAEHLQGRPCAACGQRVFHFPAETEALLLGPAWRLLAYRNRRRGFDLLPPTVQAADRPAPRPLIVRPLHGQTPVASSTFHCRPPSWSSSCEGARGCKKTGDRESCQITHTGMYATISGPFQPSLTASRSTGARLEAARNAICGHEAPDRLLNKCM